MVQFLSQIDKLGFFLQEDGTYLTISAKTGNEVILKFVDHHLECCEDGILLFSVLYMDFSSETLLILLSDFGVIQKTIKK